MSPEISHPDQIRAAQEFFTRLYQAVRGGPLENDFDTMTYTLELNEMMEQLTHNDEDSPNGPRNGGYAAIVRTAGFDVSDGEVVATDADDQLVHCDIFYYAEDEGGKFGLDDDFIRWRVDVYTEEGFSVRLVSDVVGRVGHIEVDGTIDYVEQYDRGLIVVANNLSPIFNMRDFVDRSE